MALRVSRRSIVITQFITVSAMVLTLACAFYAVSLSAQRALAASGPDMSKVVFLGSAKYVQENDATDLSAQLKTYASTEEVHFYLDGDKTAPLVGSDNGGSASYHQWHLSAPIPSGKHDISAAVKISGEWYDVSGSSTVYSLDLPVVSYVFPQANNATFRPSDNPLSVKADDEFNQFKFATFSLYKYDVVRDKFAGFVDSFKIMRDACDLRAAGNYVLCDMKKADGWQNLSEGTYKIKLTTQTMANNGIRTTMSDHWSKVFTVDATAPTITDFRIEGDPTVKDTLGVSAVAGDNDSVGNVKFYVTRPRESDGACDGNGTPLVAKTVTAVASDGRYYAELTLPDDYAAVKSGDYCVNAIAGDMAGNHSMIQKLRFFVDRTPSEVTAEVSSTKTPEASSPVTLQGKVSSGLSDLESLWLTIDDGDAIDITATVDAATGEWQYVLKDGVEAGDHTITVTTKDMRGNTASTSVSIAASPYVPPATGSVIPPEVTESLSEQFEDITPPRIAILPAQLRASNPTPVTLEESSTNKSVLGASTENDASAPSPVSAPVTPSPTGWNFFGLAWYWWLGAASGVAALGVGATTMIRRRMAVV